ncbi:retrovirus-related pol polyprotein from transposon TNT 1-94 [Tanacetum coccineum]
MKWVPKVRKENVNTSISPTIDNASRITNVLKISNTLGSNLSSVPSSSNSLADYLTHLYSLLTLGWQQRNTGNLKLQCNFVEKYLGIVRFGNDQFALILGYGDLVQGYITINRVYYIKVLNHNLFSVGQFCDADLKKGIEIGLPKLKYVKDQLCSSCEVSKAKRSSLETKVVPITKGRLNLLHMDLCGPMRVESINGKKYILMIQRNLQAQVISIRTKRGTKFLNKTLHAYFKEEGIEHQTSTPRTPEQNGVIKRRNRTLVKAARTMLLASKLPLFYWVEAIATACYTQNRSIIISTHEKTSYHIINDIKPLIRHLHIFGCTCYLTRDGENLDKMKKKRDLFILVGDLGYSTQSKGYRVYNKRTQLIVESIHLRFDEIKEMCKTFVANNTSGLVLQRQKASDYDNSDLAPPLQNVYPSADTTSQSQQELDLLFGPLYDVFFNAGTSSVNKSSSPTKNSKQQDTPPIMNIQSSTEPITPTNVNAEENNNNQAEDTQFQQDEFINPFYTRTAELKNIKEAMADSAWIKAMQEELHQFDRL